MANRINGLVNTLAIAAICSMQSMAQESPTAPVLKLPEFLTDHPPKNDTTFSFEYYDARSRKVSLDTVDITALHSISLVKNYTDKAHTFMDKDGKEKPLPISKIVYRYDRSGPGKWMTIDYATNKTGMLKEFPDEIVATMIAKGRVIKYYKVTTPKP